MEEIYLKKIDNSGVEDVTSTSNEGKIKSKVLDGDDCLDEISGDESFDSAE